MANLFLNQTKSAHFTYNVCYKTINAPWYHIIANGRYEQSGLYKHPTNYTYYSAVIRVFPPPQLGGSATLPYMRRRQKGAECN